MTNDQVVEMVEITRRRADELFDELLSKLGEEPAGSESPGSRFVDPSAEEHGSDEPWALDDEVLKGKWKETDRAKGKTYQWPDGNVDHYEEFVTYGGSGDFDGITLALGHKPDGEIAGFVIGREGGSERAITYFWPVDEFDQIGEKVSMIRGGGPRGRSGFAPSDPVPPPYADFKVEVLGDRVSGKWKRLAVVVDADDVDGMLKHTAIQARLRKLA